MKAYIAGPMTGRENLNFPAFHAEAKKWRDLGHEVVNPAESARTRQHPGTNACAKTSQPW